MSSTSAYVVKEPTIPTGWDFTGPVVCSDPTGDTTISGGGGGNTANIIVAAGETVTCTFTNSAPGTIIIKKTAIGGDDTFGFTGNKDLTASFNLTTSSGTVTQTFSTLTVKTNDRTVTENVPPAGWTFTSVVCSITTVGTGTSTFTLNQTQRKATVNTLGAGDTVTCEYTNTKQATNQAPVINSTAPTTATEDTLYTYNATRTDADGPGQTWSLLVTNTCGGSIVATTGVYTFTPAGPTPPASCVVAVQVCDGGTPNLCDSQTTTVTITAVNDAPVVSNNCTTLNTETYPCRTTQYSDAITSVTISATDGDSAGAYLSASTQWKKSGGSFAAGLPSNLSLTAVGTYTNSASWSLSGNPLVAAGTYIVRVTVTDNLGTGTGFDANFTDIYIQVNKETTDIAYTGTEGQIFTSGPLVATAPVQLSAQLTQESDGNPGDITLARVRFELFKGGNLGVTPDVVVRNIPVDSSGNAFATTSLGVDNWTIKVKVESANSYWTSPVDMAMLTVDYGSTEMRVTGGGWIPDAYSLNGKGNFGFTVNNQKNGSPKGNSIYLFRGYDGYNYLVKSNSWQGGGLTFYSDPSKASFSGKCVVQKIDRTTGMVVGSYGNYTFTVNIIDGDKLNPKQGDKYAITILDNYSNVWRQLGSPSAPLSMGGGNTSVFTK